VSFDHWWVGLFIDASEYTLLKPYFNEAAKKAVLSADSQRAIEAWRHHPADFEQEAAISEAAAAEAHAFIWAFNLPGFDALAEEFLTQNGKFTEFVSEERSSRIIMASRHTPVSILWYALGYERACLLPGQVGNMLLHPNDVTAANEKIRLAFAGTSPQDLIDRAKRYCSWSVSEDTVKDILSFLPNGFSHAQKLRLGFLALARPQI
jgi:hypothetical protein